MRKVYKFLERMQIPNSGQQDKQSRVIRFERFEAQAENSPGGIQSRHDDPLKPLKGKFNPSGYEFSGSNFKSFFGILPIWRCCLFRFRLEEFTSNLTRSYFFNGKLNPWNMLKVRKINFTKSVSLKVALNIQSVWKFYNFDFFYWRNLLVGCHNQQRAEIW